MLRSFVLLLFSSALYAHSLDFITSYRSEASFLNKADETVLFETQPYSLLRTQLGGRLAFSSSDLEDFEYKIGVSSPLLSFLNVNFTLFHANQMVDSTAMTTFLLSSQLHATPFRFLRLFASVGWFKRYVALTRATILPTPWNDSYSEHDFAFELGMDLFPEDTFYGQIKAATFEPMEVFNLNNPYGELSVGTRWNEALKLSLYSRYRILLGFGRLDQLSFGVSLLYRP